MFTTLPTAYAISAPKAISSGDIIQLTCVGRGPALPPGITSFLRSRAGDACLGPAPRLRPPTERSEPFLF